jgi:hypothetical protein
METAHQKLVTGLRIEIDVREKAGTSRVTAEGLLLVSSGHSWVRRLMFATGGEADIGRRWVNVRF